MDKEKQEEFKKDMAEFDFVTVMSVQDVNHKPFPFCVGPKHVTHASDNHSGMLGPETLNEIPSMAPKGYKGPPVYLRDVTFDTVAFLQLKRDVTHEEFKAMAPVLEKWGDDVDGIALVETEEKYKVS